MLNDSLKKADQIKTPQKNPDIILTQFADVQAKSHSRLPEDTIITRPLHNDTFPYYDSKFGGKVYISTIAGYASSPV